MPGRASKCPNLELSLHCGIVKTNIRHFDVISSYIEEQYTTISQLQQLEFPQINNFFSGFCKRHKRPHLPIAKRRREAKIKLPNMSLKLPPIAFDKTS